MGEFLQKHQGKILFVLTLGLIFAGVAMILRESHYMYDPHHIWENYTFLFFVIVFALVWILYLLITLIGLVINGEVFYSVIVALILSMMSMIVWGVCTFFNFLARSNNKDTGYLVGVYIGVSSFSIIFFGLIYFLYFLQ